MLLKLLEEAFPLVLFLIPSLIPIKCIFLVILYLPRVQGALMVYKKVLLPLIRKHKIQCLLEIVERNKERKQRNKEISEELIN